MGGGFINREKNYEFLKEVLVMEYVGVYLLRSTDIFAG